VRPRPSGYPRTPSPFVFPIRAGFLLPALEKAYPPGKWGAGAHGWRATSSNHSLQAPQRASSSSACSCNTSGLTLLRRRSPAIRRMISGQSATSATMSPFVTALDIRSEGKAASVINGQTTDLTVICLGRQPFQSGKKIERKCARGVPTMISLSHLYSVAAAMAQCPHAGHRCHTKRDSSRI
jgi:hypothetical protein